MGLKQDVKALRGWATILGKRVYRDPAVPGVQATYHLFTIAGGLVLVTSLIGEVVTGPLENVATTIRLSANPDVGAAVFLDDGTLSVQAAAVGALIYIPDVNTTPLRLANAVVGAVDVADVYSPRLKVFVAQTGTIDVLIAAQDSEEGTWSWTLHYIPIDQYASVVAA